MKIFWDPNTPINLTPKSEVSKPKKSFETYLREALKEEPRGEESPLSRAMDAVEEVLPLLERLSEDPVSRSYAETLADVLEERARMLEALVAELPEGPVRDTVVEAAVLFGAEAAKLKKGFYIQ